MAFDITLRNAGAAHNIVLTDASQALGYICVSEAWKAITAIYVCVSETWKEASGLSVCVTETWKSPV